MSLIGASDRENITNYCSQSLRFVPLLQIATFGSDSVRQDCGCVESGAYTEQLVEPGMFNLGRAGVRGRVDSTSQIFQRLAPGRTILVLECSSESRIRPNSGVQKWSDGCP